MVHGVHASGLQSSGKSSVLEAVVGTDFLPRGSSAVGIYLTAFPNSIHELSAPLHDEPEEV
jgi:Dynamin family